MTLASLAKRYAKNLFVSTTLAGSILFASNTSAGQDFDYVQADKQAREENNDEPQERIPADTKPARQTLDYSTATREHGTQARPLSRRPFRAYIDIANPLDDFDANTKLWYSLNQLGNKGLHALGDAGLNEHPAGRTLNSLLGTWWMWGTSYVSHEIAHEYAHRRNGIHDPFNFDFTNWSKGFPLFIQEPASILHLEEFEHEPEHAKEYWENQGYTLISIDDDIHATLDGLLQNEFNASFAHQEFLRTPTVWNAISYFGQKLGNAMYTWLDETLKQIGYFHEGSEGDVRNYKQKLREHKNINPDKFGTASSLTTALSPALHEAIYSLAQYLAHGTTTHEPFGIDTGDVTIRMPNFRTLPTPDGNYVDINVPLQLKDNSILHANLGIGTDAFGENGRVNNLRIGAHYRGFILQQDDITAHINPFLYANLGTNGLRGYTLGADISLHYKDIGITADLELGNNDLIENRLKHEPNGIRFRVGITGNY